ncbi:MULTISPECIES: hypothetical protein [Flavobacterium]|jgi:hypothetical protein|uniref:hypothetical protein n=1 Tax=Flavobacterium TaxID=237 RepID=UPI0006F40227|nr:MULTISPECIES: hypothetical protein [Flavobacterium]MBU7571673.1 hypothetical protein [Flavobacterium sp.]PZO30906.1 MAG: hypothetical protein DCE86_09495 [Flavobacteriaceae bacterium]PZQ85615.1 MAG: hypothetical protein DI548_08305 [Flavobacterium johnsoniae]KQS46415.1 hypothetical protein ASG38_11445 [Flavobacterium sp. Leaf359]MDQ7959220.1 hypothetical protein [Flavobacterium lindanitolerans]
MKLTTKIPLIFIIVINLINLFFIIELSNYDEMISYVKNEGEKITSPRKTVIVLLFTALINLLFVCIVFMRSLIFSHKTKSR